MLEEATLGALAPEIQRELVDNGAIVLLDGLDEVPKGDLRRAQVKAAIEDFADTYQRRCRFVVTTRAHAYEKPEDRLRGFVRARLAPFDKGKMRLFIDNWYGARVAHQLNVEAAEHRASELKETIEQDDGLSTLAERPLLLTLMVSVDMSFDGGLLERRGTLYAEAVELFLTRWQSTKDASIGTRAEAPHPIKWATIDRSVVRALLEKVAYDVHMAPPGSPEADVLGRLCTGLVQVRRCGQDVHSDDVVDYLIERAGLLVPRAPEVYTFPHYIFQKYLAACYLARVGDAATLARRVLENPERWREVAVLAANTAPHWLWSLVDELCKGDPRPALAESDLRSALIAGQMIAESTETLTLTEQTRSRVSRVMLWLLRIMRGRGLPAAEREVVPQVLVRLARQDDEVLWTLVDELCDGEPKARMTESEARGAMIAGQSIVASVNALALTMRTRPRVEQAARWLIGVVAGQHLAPIERKRAYQLLLQLGLPADEWVWTLVDEVCSRQPRATALEPELRGALIAGKAVVESADTARLTTHTRPRAVRVARWLVRIIGGQELPAAEREEALRLLSRLGLPADDVLWKLVDELCRSESKFPVADSEVRGALIAGQAIVEINDTLYLRRRPRSRVKQVSRLLQRAMQGPGVPGPEREWARRLVTALGEVVPSDDAIRQLREEARLVDDRAQVAICDKALEGDESAREQCARVMVKA